MRANGLPSYINNSCMYRLRDIPGVLMLLREKDEAPPSS